MHHLAKLLSRAQRRNSYWSISDTKNFRLLLRRLLIAGRKSHRRLKSSLQERTILVLAFGDYTATALADSKTLLNLQLKGILCSSIMWTRRGRILRRIKWSTLWQKIKIVSCSLNYNAFRGMRREIYAFPHRLPGHLRLGHYRPGEEIPHSRVQANLSAQPLHQHPCFLLHQLPQHPPQTRPLWTSHRFD